MTISEAIIELVVAKERAGCRRNYVMSLGNYLCQFAAGREMMRLRSISTQEIDAWFDRRKETPLGRRGNLGRISSLFNFAVKRGWLEKNPCDTVERGRVEVQPPRILTPGEAGRLLTVCREQVPQFLPFLVLGLFAGIRPTELQRLTWEEVATEHVTVSAAASKTRRRRIVPLEPVARAWLELCRQGTGLVQAYTVTQRRREVLCRASGVPWSHDLLRHTAASYLLAKHQDAGKVAFWLGNSPDILLRHYYQLVGADDCAMFWSLHP
jgi:integrase